MAILGGVNCYSFAVITMDNVWQYLTQPFGHIMSPKSLNMADSTYGLSHFKRNFVLHLVKNDKMCS